MTSPKWKTQAMATGVMNELTIRPSEIECILGDSAELREVLTNLIFNAVDAMPSGGTITLSTAQVDGRVILEVRDTGSGMTEEVRQRCIEPFFTTKGTAGTGLGLSMVYGIVQRHQGSVDLRTEPGVGTTFSLSFPVVTSGAFSERPMSPELGRRLRVLVVDDQPLLCTLLSEYLQQDGHTVETANAGREALEKFSGAQFDLVIVDRVMPGMCGDELSAAIKALAPDQPVLMVTGFANAPRLSYGPDVVLSKPISMVSLRDAIRSTLTQRGHHEILK
jgi:CheY-like chemotaxis protein